MFTSTLRHAARLIAVSAMGLSAVASTGAMDPHAFMAALCGRWSGSGIAEGTSVVDEVDVAWTSDQKTLVTRSQATTGDRFAAASYLSYDPRLDRFQSQERNNGKWPVRNFIGHLQGNALVLHEQEADRRVRLTLRLESPGTVHLEEALFGQGGWQPPFVNMRFKRLAAGPTCGA